MQFRWTAYSKLTKGGIVNSCLPLYSAVNISLISLFLSLILLCIYWTILHHMIYVQCQHSVLMHELVCPLCTTGRKVMDGCEEHLNLDLMCVYMQLVMILVMNRFVFNILVSGTWRPLSHWGTHRNQDTVACEHLFNIKKQKMVNDVMIINVCTVYNKELAPVFDNRWSDKQTKSCTVVSAAELKQTETKQS